jgi:uncharacterized protein with PIN domain
VRVGHGEPCGGESYYDLSFAAWRCKKCRTVLWTGLMLYAMGK